MEHDTEAARWRGTVDSFIAASAADRLALHVAMDKLIERSDRRHEEMIAAVRQSNHETRDAVQSLTNAVALVNRRIDVWEARAEGAHWLARYLPHGITAAASAVATWLFSHRGGQP